MGDKFEDLLNEYWSLAHQEGIEGRDHDTINGDAQKCLCALQGYVKELQQTIDEQAVLLEGIESYILDVRSELLT